MNKPAPLATKDSSKLRWHDGTSWRTLRIEGSFIADFSPAIDASQGVIRPTSTLPGKSASNPLTSPVLRDDAGQLRALPGGVIIVLREPLSDAAARALLEQAGAQVQQRLTETVWLVTSPAGLPSLELANRLQESGWFASAQPNWWMRRTLK